MRAGSILAVAALLSIAMPIAADESYTINPRLQQPVTPPASLKGKNFYVAAPAGSGGDSDVRIARAWTSPNPAWLPPGVNFNRELKMEPVLWQRDPVEIVRDALSESLQSAGVLATDPASADFSLAVTVYRFGLAEATWREYYSKLEMLVQVKDMRNGAVKDIAAFGTSVAKMEDRKNKSAQAIQSSLETALRRGIANFLYNAGLRSFAEERGGL